MPESPAQPRCWKTVFEARFPAKLGFYERLFPAAQRFPEYEHWETNRLSVSLRDWENRCSLHIGHMRYAYDQDSDNLSVEERNLSKAAEDLPSALDIDYFIRLGYRRRYLMAVDMPFEDLASIMDLKLLSQDEMLRRSLPGRMQDLLYRVDRSDGDWKYHITAAPVRKAEVHGVLGFNRENHLPPESADKLYSAIVASYPEVAILMDLDVYREARKPPGIIGSEFVAPARERVETLARELVAYMLTED